MDEAKNNRAVEKRLKDCLKDDRARIQIGKISAFGLMELSRQRRRTGILEGTTHVCPHCQGAGRVRSVESSALSALRAVEMEGLRGGGEIVLRVPRDVGLYILNAKRDYLMRVPPDPRPAGQCGARRGAGPRRTRDRAPLQRGAAAGRARWEGAAAGRPTQAGGRGPSTWSMKPKRKRTRKTRTTGRRRRRRGRGRGRRRPRRRPAAHRRGRRRGRSPPRRGRRRRRGRRGEEPRAARGAGALAQPRHGRPPTIRAASSTAKAAAGAAGAAAAAGACAKSRGRATSTPGPGRRGRSATIPTNGADRCRRGWRRAARAGRLEPDADDARVQPCPIADDRRSRARALRRGRRPASRKSGSNCRRPTRRSPSARAAAAASARPSRRARRKPSEAETRSPRSRPQVVAPRCPEGSPAPRRSSAGRAGSRG